MRPSQHVEGSSVELQLSAFVKQALQLPFTSSDTWTPPSPQYIALDQALVHSPALQQLIRKLSRDEARAAELPLLQQLLCGRGAADVDGKLQQFQPELTKYACNMRLKAWRFLHVFFFLAHISIA
jgi:hypothetical protein